MAPFKSGRAEGASLGWGGATLKPCTAEAEGRAVEPRSEHILASLLLASWTVEGPGFDRRPELHVGYGGRREIKRKNNSFLLFFVNQKCEV